MKYNHIVSLLPISNHKAVHNPIIYDISMTEEKAKQFFINFCDNRNAVDDFTVTKHLSLAPGDPTYGKPISIRIDVLKTHLETTPWWNEIINKLDVYAIVDNVVYMTLSGGKPA